MRQVFVPCLFDLSDPSYHVSVFECMQGPLKGRIVPFSNPSFYEAFNEFCNRQWNYNNKKKNYNFNWGVPPALFQNWSITILYVCQRVFVCVGWSTEAFIVLLAINTEDGLATVTPSMEIRRLKPRVDQRYNVCVCVCMRGHVCVLCNLK